MNSKHTLILILSSLCFIACGVKGDPVTPKNPPLPSVLENYPDIKVKDSLKETRKK